MGFRSSPRRFRMSQSQFLCQVLWIGFLCILKLAYLGNEIPAPTVHNGLVSGGHASSFRFKREILGFMGNSFPVWMQPQINPGGRVGCSPSSGCEDRRVEGP